MHPVLETPANILSEIISLKFDPLLGLFLSQEPWIWIAALVTLVLCLRGLSAIGEWCGIAFGRLRGLYGPRRLIHGLLAIPAAFSCQYMVCLFALDSDRYQQGSLSATLCIFDGAFLIAVGLLWIWLAPRYRLLIYRRISVEHVRRWIGITLVVVGGCQGAWGGIQLLQRQWRDPVRIVRLLTVLIFIPWGIAAAVAFWPDAREMINAQPTLTRWLRGPEPQERFAGPVSQRRLVETFQDLPPPEGHLFDARYVGRTLFDSHYRREHVFLRESSHSYCVAMTGAGKLITTIAPIACTHPGSAVLISPKPQLADMFCGRRQDPTLFSRSGTPLFRSPGTDVRGVTQARYHLRNGRCFVIDPGNESIWPSAGYTGLSDIDITRPDAVSLIRAVARSSVPPNPKLTEPFFADAARQFLAGGIGYKLTTCSDPREHTLPAIVDMLMGVDSEGRADPDLFKNVLISMLANNALGGLAQAGANKMIQAGSRTFGAINAQLSNALSWILDPMMRSHLNRPSSFSYRELGDLDPMTVFIIPPPLPEEDIAPFLRMHAEVSLAILKTKKNRPIHKVWYCLDEFRSWGRGVEAVTQGMTFLRESEAWLDIYTVSLPSLVETVGEAVAEEIQSCGTGIFYGIDDIRTAEHLVRILGSRTFRDGRFPNGRTCPLMTPQNVLHDLRKTSNLQVCLPASAPPMLLERMAYKPIVTSEGARFAGLPLAGHYDSLSKYTHRGQQR
jgi:hypothetical protein